MRLLDWLRDCIGGKEYRRERLEDLQRAIRLGRKDEVVRRLRRSDVNRTVESGQPLLHLAIESGNTEVVGLLLNKGADSAGRSGDRSTALAVAAKRGQTDVVQLLLARPVEVDSLDVENNTPLAYALDRGHEGIARILLERAADPTRIRSRKGLTALHMAAAHGITDIIGLLIDSGLEVNAVDDDRSTPLHWAAMKGGKKAAVELLLAQGAAHDARNKLGESPMHLAAGKGWAEVIGALLDRGADVNAVDDDKWTPLHQASLEGKKDVVDLLLARGAALNPRNKRGDSPIHSALLRGHLDVVLLLIERGADVTCINDERLTPLHSLAMGPSFGNTELAGTVLRQTSPASREEVTVAEALVRHGADPAARDKDGETPLDLARRYNRPPLVGFLEGVGSARP